MAMTTSTNEKAVWNLLPAEDDDKVQEERLERIGIGISY